MVAYAARDASIPASLSCLVISKLRSLLRIASLSICLNLPQLLLPVAVVEEEVVVAAVVAVVLVGPVAQQL